MTTLKSWNREVIKTESYFKQVRFLCHLRSSQFSLKRNSTWRRFKINTNFPNQKRKLTKQLVLRRSPTHPRRQRPGRTRRTLTSIWTSRPSAWSLSWLAGCPSTAGPADWSPPTVAPWSGSGCPGRAPSPPASTVCALESSRKMRNLRRDLWGIITTLILYPPTHVVTEGEINKHFSDTTLYFFLIDFSFSRTFNKNIFYRLKCWQKLELWRHISSPGCLSPEIVIRVLR